MALANKEAIRLNHEYIGTEHVLLGLVEEGSGVGANVLKNLNVDLYKVRSEIERLVGHGPGAIAKDKLPPTPRAEKIIEFAIAEARSLNHNYVGTEHLLLGLLHMKDGVAAQVLKNLGTNLEEAREEVCNLLGIEPGQLMALPLSEEDVRPVEPPKAATDQCRADSMSSEESLTSDKAAMLLQSLLAELVARKGHAVLDADYERAVAYRDLMLSASHLMDQLLSILRRGQPPKDKS